MSDHGPATDVPGRRLPLLPRSLPAFWVLGLAVTIAGGRLVTLGTPPDQTVVSYVDAIALLAGLSGFAFASTTRTLWPIRDPAVVLYLALLGYLGLQVLLPVVGDTLDLEIATGASRFAGPWLFVLGVGWFRAGSEPDEHDSQWRQALTAMALLVAAGMLVDVLAALGDGVTGYYDWKRAIQQELGVSNILAAYTSIGLWCSATLAVEDRRWLPASIVLALATALSLSRAAALGLLVAAVVVAVGWRLSTRLAVGGLVAVTLALTAVPIALDTQAGADGLVSSALRVRDEQFTAAWEAWQDHPLLGVGLNRFEEDVTVVTSQPSAAAVDGVIPYDHPNNAWLVALSELGLLGTALYLALWVLLGRRILALPDGLPKLAAAGAVAGLAVHAQLEALTFTRGIEFVLALLLVATWSGDAPRARPGLAAGA